MPAKQRRIRRGGAALDDGLGVVGLRADDGRARGLQDAGLFAGDRRDGVAEKRLMVERYRGDRGGRRTAQHVGRVEPAAEPGFEQHDIRRRAGEGEKRRRRGDLEKGDRRAAIDPLAFLQQLQQQILFDQPAGEADALVKADEMRRGVGMNAVAAGFETGAQRRDGRALAVGAGDVNRRRQLVLRIAERGQQAFDAGQRQVDLFRVQLRQARQHPITAYHGLYSAALGVAGTGNAISPCIGWRSNDRMRARVACNSPRGTT
jgi:hypothetical protein